MAVLTLLSLTLVHCVPEIVWNFRVSSEIRAVEGAVQTFGGDAVMLPGDVDPAVRAIGFQIVITNPRFGDRDLTAISRMPGFRYVYGLSLQGTGVTDEGVKSLENHTSLSFVALSGTRVSDKGLSSLATLDRLTTLLLDGTLVTDSGIHSFINRSKALGRVDVPEAATVRL